EAVADRCEFGHGGGHCSEPLRALQRTFGDYIMRTARPASVRLPVVGYPTKLVGVACVTLLWSASGWAQYESSLRDLMQARNYAMGGAYRALGLGAEAVDGNPAAMALHKFYEIDAEGVWDVGTKFGYGNATILESQTSQAAAGVSYRFLSLGRGDENRHTHYATLAVGFPLADSLTVGVSGHYVQTSGAFHRNGITVDAGLVFRFSDAFRVSLSGHNLVDIKNPDVVRYYAAGIGYSKGLFTF